MSCGSRRLLPRMRPTVVCSAAVVGPVAKAQGWAQWLSDVRPTRLGRAVGQRRVGRWQWLRGWSRYVHQRGGEEAAGDPDGRAARAAASFQISHPAQAVSICVAAPVSGKAMVPLTWTSARKSSSICAMFVMPMAMPRARADLAACGAWLWYRPLWLRGLVKRWRSGQVSADSAVAVTNVPKL